MFACCTLVYSSALSRPVALLIVNQLSSLQTKYSAVGSSARKEVAIGGGGGGEASVKSAEVDDWSMSKKHIQAIIMYQRANIPTLH